MSLLSLHDLNERATQQRLPRHYKGPVTSLGPVRSKIRVNNPHFYYKEKCEFIKKRKENSSIYSLLLEEESEFVRLESDNK